MNESWINKYPILSSLGLATALSLSANNAITNTNDNSTKIDFSVPSDKTELIIKTPNKLELIKSFENNKDFSKGKWNKETKRWEIYDDLGKPAIAYGHRITDKELQNGKLMTGIPFKHGITDEDADKLLALDIKIREQWIVKHITSNYFNLPKDVQYAILVAVYRGDLLPSHKAVDMIKKGKFRDAAYEFLNNKNFKTTKLKGVQNRMFAIAKIFYDYGNK
jgi:hypothetical protein